MSLHIKLFLGDTMLDHVAISTRLAALQERVDALRGYL